MPGLVRFVFAAALLCPFSALSPAAWAQVQPHRAEYALRLGAAANAPRIGTAVHDLSQDCAGWHLKRDIKTEIALTTSWKMSLASKMDGDEQRNGNGFRFSTLQIQNGSQREIKGRVQRKAGETRAEIVLAGSPPNQFVLPPPTLMPVAAIDHLIQQLQAHAASFPACTRTGSIMRKVEPYPSVDSRTILPPCISTMRLARANPRPVPPFCRVFALSTC